MTEEDFLECRRKILKLRVDGDAFQLGTIALRLLDAVQEDSERWAKIRADITRNASSSFDKLHVFTSTRSAA